MLAQANSALSNIGKGRGAAANKPYSMAAAMAQAAQKKAGSGNATAVGIGSVTGSAVGSTVGSIVNSRTPSAANSRYPSPTPSMLDLTTAGSSSSGGTVDGKNIQDEEDASSTLLDVLQWLTANAEQLDLPSSQRIMLQEVVSSAMQLSYIITRLLHWGDVAIERQEQIDTLTNEISHLKLYFSKERRRILHYYEEAYKDYKEGKEFTLFDPVKHGGR